MRTKAVKLIKGREICKLNIVIDVLKEGGNVGRAAHYLMKLRKMEVKYGLPVRSLRYTN